MPGAYRACCWDSPGWPRYSSRRASGPWRACRPSLRPTARGKPGLVVCSKPLAELRQRPGEQPGDVHLRDAELGGDLRLGHVAEEAQHQDPLLPRRQALEQRLERLPVLHTLQGLVEHSQRFSHCRGVLVTRVRRVERDRGVRVGGLQALEHLFLAHLQVSRELGHGGRPAEPLGEIADGLGQRQLEFLQPPRDPDSPPLVAEMPLYLSDNGRRRICRELDAAAEVEPVDGLDQPDRGHLGQVVEPLAAVPEPAGQVLDQRQVQLDQFAPYALPLLISLGQRYQPLEQLPGAPAFPRRVLDLRSAERRIHIGLRFALHDGADVGRLLVPRFGEIVDRRLAVGVARRNTLGLGGHRGLVLLGQRDLDLPRHTDPDDSLVFRSTIVSRSPGPTYASTLPARAVSTVHANVSLAGCCGERQGTDTAIAMLSWPRVKPHSRLEPGTAWLSSMAHASSTAILRSSISSNVKSSRAASTAVAVRSTDRYAPSAGMRTITWSCASRRWPVLDELAPSVASPGATPVTAVPVADVVDSSLTCVLPHRPGSARRRGPTLCLQLTASERLLCHGARPGPLGRDGPAPARYRAQYSRGPRRAAPAWSSGWLDRLATSSSALLGLPEDLTDLVDLAQQLVGNGRIRAGLGAAATAGQLGRLVDQLVQLRVLLKVRRLEVVGPQDPEVVLNQLRPLFLDDQRPGAELRVGVLLVLLADGLDGFGLDTGLSGVIDAAGEVAVSVRGGPRFEKTCEQPH